MATISTSTATDDTLKLVDESDRGCVLAGAAILERALEDLFRAAFTANRASKSLQDSLFDANGPLATFSSKIKLARALGFIDAEELSDLETIRKIRNEFAHSSGIVDFIEHKTSVLIEKMHVSQKIMTDSKLKRYAIPRENEGLQAESSPQLLEAKLRVMGYVKFTKSLFSTAVAVLEARLGVRSELLFRNVGE